MQDGVVGLYQNEEGVVYATLKAGETGLPFEDLLPPEMRGAYYADAPVADFVNMTYLWLATSQQWATWTDSTPPPLDRKALKLLLDHDATDYKAVKNLFAIIHPHYDKKPALGLIAALVEREQSPLAISACLNLYNHYKDKVQDLDKAFMHLFIDPNNNDIAAAKKIEYALLWCRRPDNTNATKQDDLYWNLNLRELGIINTSGEINREVAKRARDFIWTDVSRDPDYFILLEHLKTA